ncbi:MAG: transglutaminase domain-containing protein, partial [Chloroflexi bacterium]|nr:transglutaminase domain-containing protein [Chloroflexota bacterium]
VNKKRGLSVLRDGFIFTSAIMAAAFMLPSGKDIRSLDGFYNVLHSPVERYSTKFDRLFAGLYARIPGGTRVFGEQMALGGRVELSDVPLLIVQSPKPVYLGARAYDTYTSSGWTLGATEMYDLAVATPAVEGREPSSQIKVTPLFASEQRFVPVGGILQIDKPTDAEVLSATVYAVNFRNASQVAGLPDSIRSAARTIQAAARPSGSRQSPSLPGVNNLQPLIPPDIALLDVSYDRGYVAVARLMLKEPVPPDLASVRVKGGPSSDAYTTSNYASRPGPEQLEAAVSDYSLWIRDHYLQLPSTLPKRVRDLAHDVAADLATPYDKAIAIEYYLRNNIGYSTAIDAPPYNQDGVDYFLFGIKEGYCDYFASAMAVMLRSVGVPARVVSGFAPGEKAGEGSYLVRDRDAHSWPQVYFPGYGWVEFEPTPSRPGTGEPELDLSLFPDMEIPEEEFMEEEEFPMEPGIPVIPAEGQAAINWLVWGILLPGLALIVGGFAVTWRRIGSIPLSPEAGYARLLLLSRLGGMPAAASQTPYEFASTVGRRWPEAEREVWRVADSYVVASFSKARHTDRPNAENWPKIRSAFLRRLFWRPKQSSSF